MSDLKVPEINSVTISGRLTRDPELRYTNSGLAVCEFGIANNRRRKDASGNWVDSVCFLQVVVWEKAAEWIGEKIKKGRPIIVEGRLETQEYEKDGQKRSKTRIVAQRVQTLDWDEGQGQGQAQGGGQRQEAQQPRQAATSYTQRPRPTETYQEDDLPF